MTIKREVLAGLDLGSTKICAFLAEVTERGMMEVISIGVAPSAGLSKGVVVDLDSASQAVKTAIRRTEDLADWEIKKVYVGIAGEHIQSCNNSASMLIAEGEINEKHIEDLLESAKSINLEEEQELISAIPLKFILDGQEVSDPLYMTGYKLEVEMHLIYGTSSVLDNIEKCLEKAGVKAKGFIFTPIASADAVMTEQEKKNGAIAIDIGNEITGVAVFQNNKPCYSFNVPIGASQVTNDLAIVLDMPVRLAEKLKMEYGSALSCLIDPRETVEIETLTNDSYEVVRRTLVSEIIEARMQELFKFIGVELYNAGYLELLMRDIVITGGGAMLRDLPAMTERLLELTVRLGFPEGVSGFPFSKGHISPDYATAIGLIRSGYFYGQPRQKEEEEPEELPHENIEELEKKESIWQKIKNWFKNFFQESDEE